VRVVSIERDAVLEVVASIALCLDDVTYLHGCGYVTMRLVVLLKAIKNR